LLVDWQDTAVLNLDRAVNGVSKVANDKSKEPPQPPPAWVVYILRCGDGSLYTGITNDLARRLAAHRAGTAARYTRAHLPVKLAWQEPAADRPAALRREAAIKRLTRARKLALVRAGRPSRVRKASGS
jgi:putative endonuclease